MWVSVSELPCSSCIPLSESTSTCCSVAIFCSATLCISTTSSSRCSMLYVSRSSRSFFRLASCRDLIELYSVRSSRSIVNSFV